MTEPDGQDEREGKPAVRLTVAQDGSGDYDTVGAALAALGDKDGPPACIFIKEGVYRERLEITRPWITLEGLSLIHISGKGKAPAAVDLAVIRFPRISNFTDFNVFSGIPGVSLRYVTKACDLGSPDMVILPGTKNTIHDLLWMRQNGLEAAILKLAFV